MLTHSTAASFDLPFVDPHSPVITEILASIIVNTGV